MKAVVAAFNQEKALVGAFSVITNLRMELFQALLEIHAVVVLSHGNEGILYGYDHSYPAHKVGLTLANERAGH